MTRPGEASERRRRIRLGYTPGADGTLHSPQPVEPEGRRKRRKPSGHKHTEGQPPETHGPDHDAGGADENPHTTSTANPHSVTHSQVGAPTGNPHGVTASEAGAVANAVGAPSLRRETRANQPAASNVAVGSRYVVKDEENTEEVAADTSGDGSADTWVAVVDKPHRDDEFTPHGATALATADTLMRRDSNTQTEVASPSSAPHAANKDYVDTTTVADAGTTPQDQADTRANQPGADTVPVGSRYWVTDKQIYERSNGTSWEAVAAEPGAHGHDQHTAGSTPTFMVSSSVAPQHIIDAADYTTSGADDQTQVNTALTDLPGGAKTGS